MSYIYVSNRMRQKLMKTDLSCSNAIRNHVSAISRFHPWIERNAQQIFILIFCNIENVLRLNTEQN